MRSYFFHTDIKNTTPVSSDGPTPNPPPSKQPINQLSRSNTSISRRTLSDHLATLVFGTPNRIDPEIEEAFDGIAASHEEEQIAPIVHLELTEPDSLHKKIPSPEIPSTGMPKSGSAHLPSSGESLNRLDSASSSTSSDSDVISSKTPNDGHIDRHKENQVFIPDGNSKQTVGSKSITCSEQSKSETKLPQSVSDNADAPDIRTILKGVRSALENENFDDNVIYNVLKIKEAFEDIAAYIEEEQVTHKSEKNSVNPSSPTNNEKNKDPSGLKRFEGYPTEEDFYTKNWDKKFEGPPDTETVGNNESFETFPDHWDQTVGSKSITYSEQSEPEANPSSSSRNNQTGARSFDDITTDPEQVTPISKKKSDNPSSPRNNEYNANNENKDHSFLPKFEGPPDAKKEQSKSESEAKLPQSVSDNADAPDIRTYLKGVRRALENENLDDTVTYNVLNEFLNNYRTGGLGRKIGNVIATKVFKGNETFTHRRDRAADFTDKANGSEYAEKFVNYVNTHFNGTDQDKRQFFEDINNLVPQIKTAYERIQAPDKAAKRSVDNDTSLTSSVHLDPSIENGDFESLSMPKESSMDSDSSRHYYGSSFLSLKKQSESETKLPQSVSDNAPKDFISEKDSEQLNELFGTLAQLQPKNNTSASDEYRQAKEEAVGIVNGFALNAETRYGQTPLALALEQGATEIARELIDQGADINKAKGLHIAAKKGDADLFDFLKTRLAQEDKLNLEDTDRSGWTPLRVAVSYGNKNIVKQLIQDGADVFKATSEDRAFNSDNPNDETKIRPLIYDAIHLGDKEIFDLLMEKYTSENRIDEPAMFGYTPLLEAVAKKQTAMAESLVKNGANIDAKLRQGHNLFSLASDKKIPFKALKQILGDKYNNTSDTIPGTHNLDQINAKVREGKNAAKSYANSFDHRSQLVRKAMDKKILPDQQGNRM